MVKKIEIAKKLGLHVATISRILNQVPDYRASKETVRRVFKVARDMGYDFERQKRFYQRKYRRTTTNARVKLRARLSDGTVITHDARMVNMGKGGVLLADFHPRIVTIPMQEENLVLEIVSGRLKGIKAACEVVRVGRYNRSFGICVQAKGLTPDDSARMEEYIDLSCPDDS
jgi:hypothetical protein